MSVGTTSKSGARFEGLGRRSAPYFFVGPFWILFIVFMVVPLVMAAYSSFFSTKRSGLGIGTEGPNTIFVGLENYVTAFQNGDFIAGFGRVLLFGVVQVPIMLGGALILALLLDSSLVRGKRFFQLSFFLPYTVPGVVAALIWGFLYQPGISPVVALLQNLGMNPDFLAPGTVLWSIANVTTWSYMGVNMIVIFTALKAIPEDLYEAAYLDGASETRIAWSIKIPMILPAILLTCLSSIIGTIQLFNEPTVLRSITSNVSSTYTPAMTIYTVTTGQNNQNLGSAMAIVLALITLLLSMVVSRRIAKGSN